ncbi:ornithine cyclodeaminase [Sphingobium faniae]|nr:ornithine cyclodeaminase [Sphingobium faniae]
MFDWREAVSALQNAYRANADPRATPPRTIASSGKASLRCLSAAPAGQRYFGAKVMGFDSGAPSPAVQYVIVLFDRETSRIAAFVDADKVTGFRTAATSAAALDKIAPKGPLKLAVLGSGLEAIMHTRAFAAVRDLAGIAVFSPTEAKREAFARDIGVELGIPARPVAVPEDAVRDADIVLSAARSHGEKPILYGDWIKPGAVIVSIGSTVPSQREVDISVVAKADLIVCDVVHEVVEETGDMIAAAEAGIDVQRKCHSIEALMRGELGEQLVAARNPMFKSVGGGLQDVVVAGIVFDRALATGNAVQLPIEISAKSLGSSRRRNSCSLIPSMMPATGLAKS